MARLDIHRPSAINPDDYDFVALECIKIGGLEDCLFIQAERAALRAHMARTGGKYSSHDHGGNCGVCGSVNAIYTSQFYHAKTNSYVRVGSECAEKLGYGGMDAFKARCGNWLEAKAGKNKAKATLESAGLADAWTVLETVEKRHTDNAEAYAAWRKANPQPEFCTNAAYSELEETDAPKPVSTSDAEMTVVDIVRKLIKYGSISDKATNYLRSLVERIKKAPEIAAARAAEAAAAKPVPVVNGRTMVRGKVLTVKTTEGFYGLQTKMLVQHADGWKVWGTVPNNIRDGLARGDEVAFSASVKISDDDAKFGFFSRPSKAAVVNATAEMKEAA